MKRLTTDRSWKKASEDLENELGYSHIWKRLNAIEDVLGNEYNLDQLREALKKQSEYEAFMKDWEVLAEIAGAVRKAGAKRAAELVEADRDGRCVVLPCKVGDVIYRISLSESKIYEFSVDREFWNGGRFTLFSHPVLGDGKIATCYEVIEQKDFGKTVFLTPEEAQAALEIERMKIHG